MRVISSGSKYRRVDCPHCRAELEYEFSDVRIGEGPYNVTYKYIECPVCGKEIKFVDWMEPHAYGREY